MVSLKRTPEKSPSIMTEPEEAFFPHTLHLSNEEIEKFGCEGADIGDEKNLTFKVRVTGISEDRAEKNSHRGMTLSLVELITEKDNSNAARAKRIFGDAG